MIFQTQFPITTPQEVSTSTLLLPFFNFEACDRILFSVQNRDETNEVTVLFETSQDGISVDMTRTYEYVIQPGQQCSLEVGPQQLRRWYSISAQTDGPSYPTALVTWEVVVDLRLGK